MTFGNNTYYRSRSKRLQSSFQGLLNWLRRFLRARRRSVSPQFLFLGTLALFLVGVLCSQIVYRQVRLGRVRQEIHRLESKNHNLRMTVNRREVKVARLKRLDRIQKIAITQLGMVAADTVPVMKVKTGQWAQLSPEGGRSP
ncbi:MAG: septum formation initiator family protein [bacterium]